MEKTVDFRDFEERDIDFVYKCKNDEKLNRLIVGDYHPFTYEEAVKWVHGCMGEHDTYKFWAICTNDVEKRIIGWVSLSQINRNDKSACFHGIVIGDTSYREGLAWVESYLFVYEYGFKKMLLNRIYGKALVDHNASQTIRKVMFGKTESVERRAIFRNGRYYDVSIGVLLSEDYFEHKENGDYEIGAILKRLRAARKGEL